jgi:catechol 2,3-dioxygenase-like lactoylglutathione lyase family enzyme
MNQQLSMIALVVKDYDEAIDFYTQKLGFDLIEDTKISDLKRWVVVRPKGSSSGLLLAKAANENQEKAIGNQTGGRVFLFLNTDDIQRDVMNLQEQKVTIVRPISQETYGQVLVFADLYGNLWDLIQTN